MFVFETKIKYWGLDVINVFVDHNIISSFICGKNILVQVADNLCENEKVS